MFWGTEECNNPVVKVMGDPGLQKNILLPHPPQKRGCRRCPPLHPSRQHPQRWHLPDYRGRLPNLAGAAQPAWRAAGMEGLRVGSVLLTGCDGGLGLGLLKGLLEQPSPPRHIFAACLDPQGKVGRAPARAGQAGLSSGMGAWGCHNPT